MPIGVVKITHEPKADSHFASVVPFNGALRWLSTALAIAQATASPSSKRESLLMIVAGLVTALSHSELNESKRNNLTETRLNRVKP